MRKNLPRVILFVMGPTNAGKSEFLTRVASHLGDDTVGLVRIGTWMRAKYPPEHFWGEMAPEHTQEEAMAMLLAGINWFDVVHDKPLIAVDGQPRTMEAAALITAKYVLPSAIEVHPKRIFYAVYLDAPEPERKRRAALRDNGDPEAIELSMKRVRSEARQLIDIMDFLEEHTRSRIPRYNTYGDFDAIEVLRKTTGFQWQRP